MDDPDLAWTLAAYLASGGALPPGTERDGVEVADHLGHVFNIRRDGDVTVSRAFPAPSGQARRRHGPAEFVEALMGAVDDVVFSVRRARLPFPIGEVDLIEPDEPGLPVVAVGDGAWLLEADGTRPVEDDGDLAAAVAGQFAESVHGRRRSLAM